MFMVAAFCVFGMWCAIFLGSIDHFVAAGIAVLMLTGFLVSFNRACALWDTAGPIRANRSAA
jgi:hypothetical protein